MFLIAVDEVHVISNTTVLRILDSLRQMFAAYGLPNQIVTDNGSQFISQDIAVFMRNNGIKHLRSAPYHPASNGLAERFIQSLRMNFL